MRLPDLTRQTGVDGAADSLLAMPSVVSLPAPGRLLPLALPSSGRPTGVGAKTQE